MKKLSIAGLVLAMLVVFSVVANAQSWWKSQEIQNSIKITYPNFSNLNVTLGSVNGTFEGYLVAELTTATQGTAIEHVFLCGTLTVPANGATYNVWLNYPNEASFSLLGTDHQAEPADGKTDKESGNVIAVGTFLNQTNSINGPAYLNGTVTLTEDVFDNIKSIAFKGTAVGGYGQQAGSTYQFSSSSISGVLAPWTGGIPLTCVEGVVTVE